MLEAANWAPTHGKTEPWRFVVLSPDGLQQMIGITDRVSAESGKGATGSMCNQLARATSLTHALAAVSIICSAHTL